MQRRARIRRRSRHTLDNLPSWGCSGPAADHGAVVGVVDPAALGIQQVRRFVDGKKSVPFGRGIAAVHRLVSNRNWYRVWE